MTSIISVAQGAKHTILMVCLPGMIYPLFCGIGALLSGSIPAYLNPFFQLVGYSLLIIVLAVCAFISYGDIRALYHEDTEQSSTPSFTLFAGRYRLTLREREILLLLMDSLSSAEIASQLFISEKTVRNHISNMLAKTSSESRTVLVRRARESADSKIPAV
jgi:LuxR family transcriptional regulator of spore coat protein